MQTSSSNASFGLWLEFVSNSLGAIGSHPASSEFVRNIGVALPNVCDACVVFETEQTAEHFVSSALEGNTAKVVSPPDIQGYFQSDKWLHNPFWMSKNAMVYHASAFVESQSIGAQFGHWWGAVRDGLLCKQQGVSTEEANKNAMRKLFSVIHKLDSGPSDVSLLPHNEFFGCVVIDSKHRTLLHYICAPSCCSQQCAVDLCSMWVDSWPGQIHW